MNRAKNHGLGQGLGQAPTRSTLVLPTARPQTEFIVERLPDEVLVYDQARHQAHCLSLAADLVWNLCDGKRSVDEAQAALVGHGHGDGVAGIVAQLVSIGLAHPVVQQPHRKLRDGVSKSRRDLLIRGAVAAGVVVASPVIFSIVAPSVAEAASACGAKTQLCCTGNICNAGLKCVSGHCQ